MDLPVWLTRTVRGVLGFSSRFLVKGPQAVTVPAQQLLVLPGPATRGLETASLTGGGLLCYS